MVLGLFYKIVPFSVNDIYSNILTGQMCFSEKINIPYFGHGPPDIEMYKEKQKRLDTTGERWRGWPRTENSGIPMLPGTSKVKLEYLTSISFVYSIGHY